MKLHKHLQLGSTVDDARCQNWQRSRLNIRNCVKLQGILQWGEFVDEWIHMKLMYVM